MTRLSQRKSRLIFVTEDEVRYRGKYRRVVVEADASGYTARLRLEGTRARFEVSWAGIYQQAVKWHVESERRAKRLAKKEGIR